MLRFHNAIVSRVRISARSGSPMTMIHWSLTIKDFASAAKALIMGTREQERMCVVSTGGVSLKGGEAMTKRQREKIRCEIRMRSNYGLARVANRTWEHARDQALRLHEIGRLMEIQGEAHLADLANCVYYYIASFPRKARHYWL